MKVSPLRGGPEENLLQYDEWFFTRKIAELERTFEALVDPLLSPIIDDWGVKEANPRSLYGWLAGSRDALDLLQFSDYLRLQFYLKMSGRSCGAAAPQGPREMNIADFIKTECWSWRSNMAGIN
ncbi:hypothetical protein TNCV_3628921 [Trichonephila clavipes]|nr:hypothetical protein TNCV_3628921 [Trichonephila clavipes]